MFSTTIERMYAPPRVDAALDSDVPTMALGIDTLDSASCALELASSVAEQRRLGARRLALAAHWADLHAPIEEGDEVAATATPYELRARQRIVHPGSHGTPGVTEFAATELGASLELTTVSARNLLRDALELRHRHPLLWAAVQEGRVDEWKARKVVHATAEADLPLERARWVDQQTVTAICNLPFGRAMNVVTAKVMAADPELAEALRTEATSRRYVSTGRDTGHGLRTLIAQTTTSDVVRINAMLNHLAAALKEQGDTDKLDIRRAKALGLLANPALACVLLADLAPLQAPAILDGTQLRPETWAEEEPGLPPSQVFEAHLDPDLDRDVDGVRPLRSVRVESAPVSSHAAQAAAVAAHDAQLAGLGRHLKDLGSAALDRLRPRSVLYVHVAHEAMHPPDQADPAEEPHPPPLGRVARVEGTGPVTLAQVKEWLAHEQVTVKPVIDPAGIAPVDGYEVPDRLAEALVLQQPIEVFPFGTLNSRRADRDHTVPYVPMEAGGPAGQTQVANLGPLGRGHHRAKTFGAWTLRQPLPGMYLWKTPTGHWYQVDNQGTVPLGTDTPLILRQLDGGCTSSGLSPAETVFARTALRVELAA